MSSATGAAAALFQILAVKWQAFRQLVVQVPPVPEADIQQWRPPQWNSTLLYMMTQTVPNPESGEAVVTNYFFDAVLRAEHYAEIRKSEHPNQIGASTVDHTYNMPSRLVLEIGMSDVMDRYVASLYTSNDSKSVSAYRTFVALKESRQPLDVTTRLFTYKNMLIESIRALENNKTQFSLRAVITFSQLLTGNIEADIISARPQVTDETPQGTITPDDVDLQPAHTLSPFTIKDIPPSIFGKFPDKFPKQCPGAGDFASFKAGGW